MQVAYLRFGMHSTRRLTRWNPASTVCVRGKSSTTKPARSTKMTGMKSPFCMPLLVCIEAFTLLPATFRASRFGANSDRSVDCLRRVRVS
jgi:hypothetical protein